MLEDIVRTFFLAAAAACLLLAIDRWLRRRRI